MTSRRRSGSTSSIVSSADGSMEGEDSSSDSSTNYAVKSLLAHRENSSGEKEYRILWSTGEKSWEPKGNLDCDDLLREYHVGLLAREIQYSPPDDALSNSPPKRARLTNNSQATHVSSSPSQPIASTSRLSPPPRNQTTSRANSSNSNFTLSLPRSSTKRKPASAVPMSTAPARQIPGEFLSMTSSFKSHLVNGNGKKEMRKRQASFCDDVEVTGPFSTRSGSRESSSVSSTRVVNSRSPLPEIEEDAPREKGKAVQNAEPKENSVDGVEEMEEAFRGTQYYRERIAPLLEEHPSLSLALRRALGFNPVQLMRLRGKICIVISSAHDQQAEECSALNLLLQYHHCSSPSKMDDVEIVLLQNGHDESASAKGMAYLAAREGRTVEFYTVGGEGVEVREVYESGMYIVPTLQGLIKLIALPPAELEFLLNHSTIKLRLHPATLLLRTPDYLSPDQLYSLSAFVPTLSRIELAPALPVIERPGNYPPAPYPSTEAAEPAIEDENEVDQETETKEIIEALAETRSIANERWFVLLDGDEVDAALRTRVSNQGIELLSVEQVMRVIRTSSF